MTSETPVDVVNFPPEVVTAVARHMNDDHAEDSLAIVRALGGHPEATAATLIHVDSAGLDFDVTVGGEIQPLRIAWSQRVTERPQIRQEIVRMYDEAAAKLGLPPRVHDEQH